MVEVCTDDGQTLVALNEVFLGHPSHQTAHYTLQAPSRPPEPAWPGSSARPGPPRAPASSTPRGDLTGTALTVTVVTSGRLVV